MPLVTVLQNREKLDCNFRLDRPVALPSYRVLSDEVYIMDAEAFAEE